MGLGRRCYTNTSRYVINNVSCLRWIVGRLSRGYIYIYILLARPTS